MDTIRHLYPYDRPTFTRDWQGMAGTAAVLADMPALMIGGGTAILLGLLAWKQTRTPLGVIELGAAGSILGAVIYNFIKDVTE